MTPRNVLILNLALLAIMILASRLALVIHEVGGHALPAKVLGARTVEVRLSPLGGGYVSPTFPASRPPSPTGAAIFSLGGIALNLLTGLGAWIGARRLKSRGLIYAALLFTAVGSVAGALSYLGCGFYYSSGDPVGFAPVSGDISRAQGVWILFVPLMGAVGWIGGRHYLDFLAGRWGMDSAPRRLGALLLSAGLVGLGYGGLWFALQDPKIEGSTRQWRLEREVEMEVARRAQAQMPTPPPVDPAPRVLPQPAPPPPVVRPEEVADRVPPPTGPIVLYGIAVLGVFVGAAAARPQGAALPVRPALAIGLALSAALVVSLFRYFG